ncbi:MAG: c-type cytochrome [Deltaproteobacteria bacterium]|nr:c-type cytochrome [Deltaproteobacteria bacterium]
MRDIQVRQTDLGMTRLLRIFAALAVVFVAVLAIAPVRSRFTEWRDVQERYNELAEGAGAAPLDLAIQQIWKPALGITDRCTTCHVAMGTATPLAGEKLFAAHPDVHHDPADLGCTVCHGGQGRATKRAAAHGDVEFWDDPLVPRRYAAAGCGGCHTHLRVPAQGLAARGAALFARYDCPTCHAVDGHGGRGGGPELTLAGFTGVPEDWHERHLRRHRLAEAGPWRDGYGELPAEDAAAITEYLRSRFGGAPLAEAKIAAHRLGCRGCHKIDGAGGDAGPDLTSIGRRLAAQLDFTGVGGERTTANWLAQHFRDPVRVVPGSQMPDLGLDDAQIEQLDLYMFSLRALDVPAKFWPPDRVRAARLGERDFATDGETLFGVFCAGCHGADGRGRQFGSLPVAFPGVARPGFLAAASDAFLVKTIEQGRPGRLMPAWGAMDGGLRPAEIDALVTWLRGRGAEDREARAKWSLPPGDGEAGKALFAERCASCHGAQGEGLHAPQLANVAFREAATDEFLAATIALGRAGTQMPSFAAGSVSFAALDPAAIADLVAFVRALPPPPPPPSPGGTP